MQALLPGFEPETRPTAPDHDEACFRVVGTPTPQGSMRAYISGGHAHVTHVKAGNLATWRASVTLAAQQSMRGRPPMEGPVEVSIIFNLVRPKTIKPNKRPLPCCPPDLDKLLRATMDAMAKVVYVDDGQATDFIVRKRYADGCLPGADIWVRQA
jgi:Holliday junction resolvase RusA-like endonuclease